MTIRLVLCLAVAAFVATALAPFATAHGSEQAAETEIHLIEDEADDSFYETGGYDIYQVFLGEAHMEDLGDAVAGDTVYFRTILYGDHAGRPPGQSEFRVVFRMNSPAGEIERYFATTDGKTFTTDFDFLDYAIEATEVIIKRAAISLNGANLSVGDALTDFTVESFVDGDLRDAAPGTIYVPGSGGQLEVPDALYPFSGRGRLESSVALTGPSKYATATVTPRAGEPQTLDVVITTLLKEGSQHVHAEVVGASWTAEVLTNGTGGELKPGEATVVSFRIVPSVAPGEDMMPGRIDVFTDLGGRVSYALAWENGAPLILPEGAGNIPINALEQVPIVEAPGPGVLVTVAGLGALAVALRRR